MHRNRLASLAAAGVLALTAAACQDDDMEEPMDDDMEESMDEGMDDEM